MPKIIEEPRKAILTHAKNIVVKDGTDQLTIRKVAKDTGISIGTIYNYFPTKRDLLIQLMEDYWNSYLLTVEEIDKQHKDLFQKLLEIYTQLESFVITFREVWIKNISSDHSHEDLIQKKNFHEKLNKMLEKILLDAQEKGSISLSIDAYSLARFLMQNFFMMALMKQFDYKSFEKIMRKLLQ